MNHKRVSQSPLAAAVLIGLSIIAASAVSGLATSSPKVMAPAPASIATVDMQRLMQNLDELKARNEAARPRTQAMQSQLDELRNRQDEIKSDLKDKIPASDVKARQIKMGELIEIETLLEARVKVFRRLVDLDNGDIIKDMYAKAQSTISAFAEREGYDLIMLDDRGIDMPSPDVRVPIQEVSERISNKRVLFARGSVDVTDRLIQIMNTEFRAGR